MVKTTERKQFFDVLHNDIALECSLTPSQVESIRSWFFNGGTNFGGVGQIDDLKAWAIGKLIQSRYGSKSKAGRRYRSIFHYREILAFAETCALREWLIVTKKTEYDK
jgi:hypothetical protein